TTGSPLMQAGKGAKAAKGASGSAAAGQGPSTRVRPRAAGTAWEYAPAPESREVVSLAAEYGLFVNGGFAPAGDGQQFVTLNPATQEPLARVAAAGPADVDRAVAAARTAYDQVWGPMPGAERAKYLYRIAR